MSLELLPGEVHVWLASWDEAAVGLAELRAMLSEDEREREERFAYPHLSDRYGASRGILRDLLGRYLDAAPEAIRFVYSVYGKPALDAPWSTSCIEFNVSHSESLALFGFTRGARVGVDIEYYNERADLLRIAERFFAPREYAAILALPEELQRAAFYTCWTRKEAYVKARGEGLSTDLNRFAVTVKPDEPPVLLEADFDDAKRWTLFSPSVDSNYATGVAVEGPAEIVVRHWRYSPR